MGTKVVLAFDYIYFLNLTEKGDKNKKKQKQKMISVIEKRI